MTNNLMWLPYYSIKNGVIYYLNQYCTNISVTPNVESYFTTLDKLEYLNFDKSDMLVLEKLKSVGIIMEIENAISKSDCTNNILVIQPHSDDFALSCGGTVSDLCINKGYELFCLTVFSNCSADSFPWNNSIKMSDYGYSELRKKEDTLATKYLRGKVYFLGNDDSVLRRKGIGVISKSGILKRDYFLVEMIYNFVMDYVGKINPKKIFVPAAFGWHYDHLLVYGMISKLVSCKLPETEIYLYEDYPYCNKDRFSFWKRLDEISGNYNVCPVYNDFSVKVKSSLINFYKSQFLNWNYKEIFRNISELAKSTLLEGKFLGHDVDSNRICERVWKVCGRKAANG